MCTTRRGRQFNSMVHEKRDPLTGAERDAIYMNEHDAAALNLGEGERVVLSGPAGKYARMVFMSQVAPGNLQVHRPQGSVLINGHRRSAEPKIPDYNAVVPLTKEQG